jgi:hypothetical protein
VTGADSFPCSHRIDEEALRWLSAEYAAAVDRRDGQRFAALFVPEGALVVPDYPHGLAPVVVRSGRRVLERIPDGLRNYRRTFHQTSDHRYTVDGDRASGDVRCVAHHVSGHADKSAVGTDTVWYLHYQDEYARTEAGWRFLRREIHLQFVEELPVVVVGD